MDGKSTDHVKFRAFHGIAPTLYQRVFAYRDRKDSMGTLAEWQPRVAVPTGAAFGVERPKMEVTVSKSVAPIIDKVRILRANKNSGKADAGESADRADS